VTESPEADRKTVWLAWAAFGAILGLAAFLRLWHLDQNGYGRQYYAAGVRSMMDSAHAFFYNAFDPAAFLSIDKPPVALWMQVLSARLLGFSAFSVMLTQVVLGVLSVWLIHRLVARPFGRAAALVAALCLALTPISVAVDRSNNTESALTLVLLLAAWALLRATEAASGRLLVLAMALIGVGFNVKMAAALILAPTFFLVYFLGAAGLTVGRRLVHLATSCLVMVAVSLSWMTFYDLTPVDQRPYAGSTQHNSMTELMLVHNGLSRFMPRAPQPLAGPAGLNDDGFITAADLGLPDVSAVKPQRRAAPLWDQSATGPLRLVSPFHAAQMGWWLPWAVAAVVLGAAGWRRGAALTPAQSSLLLWGGWVLSYGAVFSFASGVFHTYYLHVMGPPLGALAGIGWAALRRPREGGWRHGLSVTLLVTAAWLFYIERGTLDGGPTWHTALFALSMVGLLAAAVGTMVLSPRLRGGPVATALATTGLVASLLLPTAWALSTVLVRPNVAAGSSSIGALFDRKPVDPDAEPARRAARDQFRRLVGFLKANRADERFLVAVPNATQSAPIIVHTGESVMTLGGYLGTDPILTPADLERRVKAGDVRFVVLGGPSLVALENTASERALAQWVRAQGVPVPQELWRSRAGVPLSDDPALSASPTAAQLYDLRPPPGGVPYRRAGRSPAARSEPADPFPSGF